MKSLKCGAPLAKKMKLQTPAKYQLGKRFQTTPEELTPDMIRLLAPLVE